MDDKKTWIANCKEAANTSSRGMHLMQIRKGNEGQGTARSASKAPGRKQSGEQASPANENTAGNHETNQGTAAAQSTAQNQGRVGDRGTSGDRATPNQQKGA